MQDSFPLHAFVKNVGKRLSEIKRQKESSQILTKFILTAIHDSIYWGLPWGGVFDVFMHLLH
jgi:hypothetical protein